jgi:hypothetical protein
MIDDEHFLVKHGLSLGLYKFDVNKLSFINLDSAELGERLDDGDIFLDQLDKSRFIIYHVHTDGFYQSGRIKNEKIVLDEVAHLGIEEIHYCKLVDGQFSGFFVDERLSRFEFNLETRKYQLR